MRVFILLMQLCFLPYPPSGAMEMILISLETKWLEQQDSEAFALRHKLLYLPSDLPQQQTILQLGPFTVNKVLNSLMTAVKLTAIKPVTATDLCVLQLGH